MGTRRIRLSYDALYDLLRLPVGGKITKLGQDFTDQVSEQFQLLIDHPDFPESPKGEIYPKLAIPSFHLEESGRVITFDGWGLDG